jgi:hypothetical protein
VDCITILGNLHFKFLGYTLTIPTEGKPGYSRDGQSFRLYLLGCPGLTLGIPRR